MSPSRQSCLKRSNLRLSLLTSLQYRSVPFMYEPELVNYLTMICTVFLAVFWATCFIHGLINEKIEPLQFSDKFDIGYIESDEPVVVIEQPKKKKTPSKKKAEVKEEPKPEVSEETFNEAWADTFLEATEKLIVMQETKEELTGFYKANTEAIARLKTDFPLHKEKLDQIFKDHAESLEDNSQENKE